MNSEELEQSLRTEFENYLRNTLAEMKQEVSDFEEKIQSEFEKHKSHIDGAFQEFSEKVGDGKVLEESFRDTVSEHLKLAREEGSRITAEAFAEAEKLKDEEEDTSNSDFTAQFADIRDAINDISDENSQSEILKSLVHHSTQFTPRGAFFIVKNEHLVGWRMFGMEEHSNPQVIREVFFPLSSKTALSESIETLATIEGSSDANEDHLLYLNKLGFEQPEKMYAIPLVARGRGVAVLYADNGTEGGTVNIEVLETLMRVAGLTVEVLASTQIAKNQSSEKSAAYTSNQEHNHEIVQEEVEQQYAEVDSTPAYEESQEPENTQFEETNFTSQYDSVTESEFQPLETQTEPAVEETYEEVESDSNLSYDTNSWEQPVEEPVQEFSRVDSVEDDYSPVDNVEDDYSTSFDSYDSNVEEDVSSGVEDYSTSFDSGTEDSVSTEDYSASFDSGVEDSVSTVEDYQIETSQPFAERSNYETTQFDSVADTDSTVDDSFNSVEMEQNSFEASYDFETSNDTGFETVSNGNEAVEEVVEDHYEDVKETVGVSPSKARFGDRNVDLPIEVAEDERRLHNDARRFARLLVSEIKLYNEQKVKEGRETSDLYERLREAIDRSREMYDKRVQPPVAAKFDYFNYELVNTLAEGDEARLGESYPGATV